MYRWDLLTVCLHPNNFSIHRHCNSVDIMFLICYMTSCDPIFKWLYEFMGGGPSQEVTALPCLVVIDLIQVEIKNI